MGDEKPKFGPTGEFPEGKISSDDCGGIKFGVTTHKGQVVIYFGAPVEWISGTPEQVLHLSDALKQKALELIAKRS